MSQQEEQRPLASTEDRTATNDAHRNGLRADTAVTEGTDKQTTAALRDTYGGQLAPKNSNMTFKAYLKKFWHDVISYCAVFWSFGMCVAFLGPTLLDLGCMTSSDMKAISWVFFAQLLCSLIGASLAGYLVERKIFSTYDFENSCDANYLILVSTILIPISMTVIPFCRVLTGLAIVLALMGFNMGMIDCLANLQMIKLFGDAVPPFLQAMHFCYGLGAFVSPMIAEPFLLNEDCSPFIDNKTQPAASSGLIEPSVQEVQNDTSLPAHTLSEAQKMTEVQYAFWIMAATQVPIPFLVLSLIIRNRVRGIGRKHRQLDESDSSPGITPTAATAAGKNEYGAIDKNENLNSSDSKPNKALGAISRYHVITITVATAIMLFIYDGLQSAYGGYVYSYAVKSIADLNTTEGAYLNAMFWGMFALGRLLSIPLATRFNPACMLLCNVVGCTFSMTLMLSMRHSRNALYVGTCLFGIFLSSVAPTAISLAEQFIDISSRITSAIVVVGAVGEMVCPVVVGNIFVLMGPVSFLAFGEIMCAVSIFVFTFLWMVGRWTPKQLAKGKSSFLWCTICCARPPPQQQAADDPAHVTTQRVKYHQQNSTESSGAIEMANVKPDTDRSNGKLPS